MAALSTMIVMRNAAATVGDAVRSALAGGVNSIEVVVIDDGSTDGSAAAVESITRQDGRVRLLRQQPSGIPAARNRALDEARGEWLHFLDADDLVIPGRLGALVAAARDSAPAGRWGAYGGYAFIDGQGHELGRQTPVSAAEVRLGELIEWNRLQTSATLFHRSMLGSLRFDESQPRAEDYDLWLRMACRGARWRGVEQGGPVCKYRVWPGGASRDFAMMQKCHERALGRAFMEAAELGWAERGVDLSGTRLDALCRGAALSRATMTALAGGDRDVDDGLAMLGASRSPDAATGADAAGCVSPALLFGVSIAPDVNGRSERAWVGPLDRWWAWCEERGWLARGGRAEAWRVLPERLAHPDDVAEAVLGRCGGAERLVVIGLDAAGRRLARLAAARGIRVAAWDDGSTPRAQRELLEPDEGVELIGSIGRLPPAAAVVVCGEGSGGSGSFGGARTVRWAEERAREAQRIGRLLGEALAELRDGGIIAA